MKLSVILPCFNGADTLATQLEALLNQQWYEPWEVIVSDNGSTDESVAIVEKYKEKLPNLRVLDASDKRGRAHACNVGVLAAAGEALAFCDADDEVALNWVAAMGEALSRSDFVACQLDDEKLNEPWTLKYRTSNQRDGLQKYEAICSLPHAAGASLGIKRSLYDAIGGFDESILILEDTDFCWKIQQMGVELHFVPEAIIYYRFRHTLDGIYRQAFGYGEGQVLLYKKYKSLGKPKVFWIDSIKTWLLVLKYCQLSWSKKYRAKCLWQLGFGMGRLYGFFKYLLTPPRSLLFGIFKLPIQIVNDEST